MASAEDDANQYFHTVRIRYTWFHYNLLYDMQKVCAFDKLLVS